MERAFYFDCGNDCAGDKMGSFNVDFLEYDA
jgi:hypothetical protein